jgi:hypothetical protein
VLSSGRSSAQRSDHELVEHQRVERHFSHRRVREVEPLLDNADASMVSMTNDWRPPMETGSRVWRDQRHLLGPRHHQVYLAEELSFERSFGLALESAFTPGSFASSCHCLTLAKEPRGCAELP